MNPSRQANHEFDIIEPKTNNSNGNEETRYQTALGEQTRTMATLTKLQPIRIPKFDDTDIEGSLLQLEQLSQHIPTSQHAQLIVTFLAASSKLELLGDATEQQRTDVREFI
jgi:hypothetical protein